MWCSAVSQRVLKNKIVHIVCPIVFIVVLIAIGVLLKCFCYMHRIILFLGAWTAFSVFLFLTMSAAYIWGVVIWLGTSRKISEYVYVFAYVSALYGMLISSDGVIMSLEIMLNTRLDILLRLAIGTPFVAFLILVYTTLYTISKRQSSPSQKSFA